VTYEESLRRFRKRARMFGIPMLVTAPAYFFVVTSEDFDSVYTNWCVFLLFQSTVVASVIHSTSYKPIPPDTDLSVYIPRFKWRHFGTITLGCCLVGAIPFAAITLGSTPNPELLVFSTPSIFVVWCLGCGMIHHGLKHKLRVHSEYPDSDPGEDPAAAAARHSSVQRSAVYMLIALVAFVAGLWIWGRLSQ